jgi:hypothetical protein
MYVDVEIEDYELRRSDTEVIYCTVKADRVEIDEGQAVDPTVVVVCVNCNHPVTVTDEELGVIEAAVREAAETEAEERARATWEP